MAKLSKEEKEFGIWFIQQLKSLKHVSVDMKVWIATKFSMDNVRLLKLLDTLPVIFPYSPSLHTVFTGDAPVNEVNKMVIANPHYCLDIEKAEQSLKKIKSLNPKNIYYYHGGKIMF